MQEAHPAANVPGGSSPTRYMNRRPTPGTNNSNGNTRLDNAIDNIARNRQQTSSRKNSASSTNSSSSRLPNVADPTFSRNVATVRTRDSTQSFQSQRSANVERTDYMPPPRAEADTAQTHRRLASDDWAVRGAATKTVEHVDNHGVKSTKVLRKSVKDFNFARTLGEGSYSTVIAATDRQTLREYAIKVLDKRHIIKEKKVKYVNIERNTLFRLGEHPGVVRLYYTFQDENSLYFVLDLAANGELLGVLKKLGTFDEECARYYSAQILDAIGYMHSRGVIHRDLKPENVLLDDKMRVKIADFGTAKLLDLPGTSSDGTLTEAEERARSFVGTAEYVSPELLTEKSTCKASDLWALGCILFQLIAGKPPFKAGNEYQTFQKIVHLDYTFPPAFPSLASDLIKQLLVLKPTERLSVAQIKAHPFYAAVDWKHLWRQKAPKLKPYRPPAAALYNGIVESPRHVYSQPTSANSSSAQLRPPITPRVASTDRIDRTTPILREADPTELDFQFSDILSLPSERILKLGTIQITTSTTDQLPRKFNKLLNRKKSRFLLVTTHGRCLYLESATDKRIKSEIQLTGSTTTSIRRTDSSRSWIVETPTKSYLMEDQAVGAESWIAVLQEANSIISKRT